MKHKLFMKKIMEQLTEYKGVIDSLSSSYLEERTKHEKELEGMRGEVHRILYRGKPPELEAIKGLCKDDNSGEGEISEKCYCIP